MTPLSGYVGYALRRAQGVIFADFNHTLAELNLRPGQFAVLMMIDQNPGTSQSSHAARSIGAAACGRIAIAARGQSHSANRQRGAPAVARPARSIVGAAECRAAQMTPDPREIIAKNPMSGIQIAVVAITIGLNALDGFDVLAISFASPGIARAWGIDRAALGFVLSMELIGMGLGSIFLGGVADKIGRRRTLLGCLTVMTVGMIMATRAKGVYDLSVWRVFTGLGIGGMLAAINAVAAEFSNARRRSLNVSLMAIGYPIGAVVGGSISALLLKQGDWRVVFEFGAAATAAFIPLVLWFVPESISWLCRRQPAGALAGVNRGLGRMGRPPVAALPELSADERKRSVGDIFSAQLVRVTWSGRMSGAPRAERCSGFCRCDLGSNTSRFSCW